jgi:hypothetical protein
MAPDPNNAAINPCTEVARYLLGIGPMPPPTPQDLALARLCTALNGGAFKHPWNVDLTLQMTPLTQPGPVQGTMPPVGRHRGTQTVQTAMQLEG